MSAVAYRSLEIAATPFERREPGVGRFTMRPLDPARDAAMVHRWVTAPHAGFWNMADKTVGEIETFYARMAHSQHAGAWIGEHEGRPAFLAEIYDPRHDQVGDHYAPQDGDRGMHILVAPAEKRLRGFTLAAMRTVMGFLFDDPATRRVVVEPDIRNDKIHALNRKVGFVYGGPATFREKTAHLAFCARADFEASLTEDAQ